MRTSLWSKRIASSSAMIRRGSYGTPGAPPTSWRREGAAAVAHAGRRGKHGEIDGTDREGSRIQAAADVVIGTPRARGSEPESRRRLATGGQIRQDASHQAQWAQSS